MPKETKFYDCLGVSTDADEQTIKKAYRKKALLYHPDKHATKIQKVKDEMSEKFKEASTAYQVLTDKEKRERYDEYGEDGLNNEQVDFNDDIFADIFAQMGGMGGFAEMFGGGRRGGNKQSRKFKVNPVIIQQKINLKDAYKGKTFTVEFERNNLKDSSISLNDLKCSECDGVGIVNKMRQVKPGMFQQSQSECDNCNRSGCDTSKITTEKITKEFELPKGIFDNQKIVLDDEGHELPGGGRSQVVIVIDEKNGYNVKQSDGTSIKFVRGANNSPHNLQIEITIPIHKAICGVEMSLVHLDGSTKKFAIPQNCYDDAVIVNGMGMPHLDSDEDYGDLFVVTKIKTVKRSQKEKSSIWEHFTGKKMPKAKLDETKSQLISEIRKEQEERQKLYSQMHASNDSDSDNDNDNDNPMHGGQPQCAQQ